LLTAKQGTTTKESYTYDVVGNRLSSLGVSPYTYNSSNELTSLPSGSYTYDNNGNTKTKPDGTQYTWNFDNRLTQAVLPGSGGTLNFRYDPFGRRIQKAFTQGSTTTTTNYLYDGENLLEELDSAGNVLARYTQEMRWDGPLSTLRGGLTSYYEQDGLNSVSSLSNSSGTLAQTYIYDSYGKVTAFTGNLTNSFQFTGREFDAETGIEHYRARYYDSTVGRFISEDPVGQLVGPNFYEYVLNRPTTLIDPSGEFPSPTRPYRWRYCTGSEVSACKKICEFEGKKYVSCRVSQRYRIGPRGWSIGPEWVDGPLSCNCSDKDECHKASMPDPNADTYMQNLMLGIGIGIGVGIAPEVVIPVLPKIVPEFAH
jgi:RHS repeat-associated protein